MSLRKSLTFSFLDRYSGLVITMVSSMVIARLLTPAEIGIYSVTMVLLMLASTVRDMGAGQYLVQETDLTIDRIRAVWTIQLGLGLGLASVVVLVSNPVAVFYNEPRMRDIMLVVALNYAINPFGSLTHAWLMREMLFGSSALIRISGGLTGALVSTWLAWKNYGPMSLAFGTLASTVVGAIMAVYFRPKFFPWLPGLGEIKRVFIFGSQVTASNIVNVMANGSPDLLLGKLQNLEATGLYSRANGLVQMFHRLFIDAVGTVCLPWFAGQSREHGSVVEPFIKATAYVTAFGWSFCLALVCLAHPIVRVLYGRQWDQSVDLTRMLAVAMAFTVPVALCRVALLSCGGASAVARVTVYSALQSIVLVALGAWLGLAALGFSLIAAAAVEAAIWLRATNKHIGLPTLRLLRALRQSALVALLSAIGPALSLLFFGPYPADVVAPLVLGCAGGLAGFVAGIAVFHHPLQEEVASAWSSLRRKSI